MKIRLMGGGGDGNTSNCVCCGAGSALPFGGRGWRFDITSFLSQIPGIGIKIPKYMEVE
jgi:hypothetical protein